MIHFLPPFERVGCDVRDSQGALVAIATSEAAAEGLVKALNGVHGNSLGDLGEDK